METEAASLKFVPAWYQVGNADHPGMAILYGIVAMATVWMFESIIATVLYKTTGHTITLSQIAALICYNGSSWKELIRWQLAKKHSRPLNKRAYFAVVLRLLATVVDIIIIILAVPGTTSVTERDVGVSQINLIKNGAQLLPGDRTFTGVATNGPCLWDRLPFRHFSPSVATLVCANAMDDNGVRESNTSTNGFTLKYDETLQRLEFRTLVDNRPFYVTHNLFVPSLNEDEAPITYNMPFPSDIESQVTTLVLNNLPCSIATPAAAAAGSVTTFNCNGSGTTLTSQVLGVIFENVYTTPSKTNAPTRKVMANQKFAIEQAFVTYGTINRPLLCIYPALILLGSLVITFILFRFVRGTCNIELNLFSLVSELLNVHDHNTETSVKRNPLIAPNKSLPRGDNGEYLPKSPSHHVENGDDHELRPNFHADK